MKKEVNHLLRLEALLTNDKTGIIIERDDAAGNITAIRTLDGALNGRTHNIVLHAATGTIIWNNDRSKEWQHQFETPAKAQEWWNHLIEPRIIQRKQHYNAEHN